MLLSSILRLQVNVESDESAQLLRCGPRAHAALQGDS